MFWSSVLVYCFSGLFVREVSRRAGAVQCHPILKGPPSSSVAKYHQISIISVLSKVFECLVSVRLKRFMDFSGVPPINQFAY